MTFFYHKKKIQINYEIMKNIFLKGFYNINKIKYIFHYLDNYFIFFDFKNDDKKFLYL